MSVHKVGPISSQVDLRGYSYALEPLQRKQQWALASLLSKLGRAQKACSNAQATLDALQTTYQQQVASAGQWLQQPLDPQAHARALAYLTLMAQRIFDANQALSKCHQERQKLLDACTAQQQKIEVLSRHRDETLQAYAQEQSRQTLVQADRDWIAHSYMRAKNTSQIDAILAGEGHP